MHDKQILEESLYKLHGVLHGMNFPDLAPFTSFENELMLHILHTTSLWIVEIIIFVMRFSKI